MLEHITLELSLKPFKSTDKDAIRTICIQAFEAWRPLLVGRKSISVLLWASDGSELLDYAGELSAAFEWCRFIGTANLPYLPSDMPKETSLHRYKQDYISNPPVMTYAILKEIVSTLKSEGKRLFPEATIRVGETFDIGPEFALSDFKYNRHTEITVSSSAVDRYGFVDATACLHADERRYAAYPDGIPEGTPFGTFLGKQAKLFLKDMGFDYLWLSNGLGFSADPWIKTGKIFDGERFYPERLALTKDKVLAFWRLFRAECDLPLETRGTNNSAGIDYATDGVPLFELYRMSLDITAPPNSPWAAINDNFGLEMMGHMTRICELPSNIFPFRYYLHDPWWVNSPWYDRYDGAPSDIYLPMAISRINGRGEVESANSMSILSIDNSYGEMPAACVNEPLPHFLKAEKNAPDAPAPLVWVYPLREYTTASRALLLKEMYDADHFIEGAINEGLPLCCVVSTDNFLKTEDAVYRDSILLSPVPERHEVLSKLLHTGKGVIFYGSRERLAAIPNLPHVKRLATSLPPRSIREALSCFGYDICFDSPAAVVKVPTLAISRCDNAHFFSVYSANTATKTRLRFPLGAPILLGGETLLEEGYATYHFERYAHRECRFFVKQTSGVLSAREAPPGNARFRRKIALRGLCDATVYAFPEPGCEAAVATLKALDGTPVLDSRFTRAEDERGVYLKGEHIDGDVYLLMGRRAK